MPFFSTLLGEEKLSQVDLEKLVSDYTWGILKRDLGCCQPLFHRRKDYVFDIQWGYVGFKHVTKPREGDDHVHRMPPQPEIELCHSEYENKSLVEQSYKFTTSRQTSGHTRFEMRSGYTIGSTKNITVKFGKDFANVGGGYSETTSYDLTKTEAEDFTTTQSWNIDTEIKVPKWQKATAHLCVCEAETVVPFKVETTIRLATDGGLPVIVRQAKTGQEVDTLWITNLGCLFNASFLGRCKDFVEIKEVIDTSRSLRLTEIVITSAGVCKKRGYRNQHLVVECVSLASRRHST